MSLTKKISAKFKLIGKRFTPVQVTDTCIQQHYNERIARSKNPLNKYGMKSFSQADEDGITLEILRRLEIDKGTYCEYGLGDGLECNTLALAVLYYRGFWVSGQELGFNPDGLDKSTFSFFKTWITSENVVSFYHRGCSNLGVENVDILSFDLDYNDLTFVDLLLKNKARPKLFIVEYNAKFIPPARFSVEFDDAAVWDDSDYMGASLQSFIDLFATFDYQLVCCNAATGSNAYFVHQSDMDRFLDIPDDVMDIYQTPYYMSLDYYSHVSSGKTGLRILQNTNEYWRKIKSESD